MKKLLIATTNTAKIAEHRKFLADLPLNLVNLTDLGITQKAVENGATLEENALIKAHFYCQISHLPTLSDDGGFEIDALQGEPGVRAHRWVNQDREDTDEEIITEVIKRLKNVSLENRGAQLVLALGLVLPDGQEFTVREVDRGIIPLAPSPKRHVGFPYRSLLFFPEINKYYIDLDENEMERYNHRKRAIKKFKPIIQKLLTERP